MEQVTHPIAPVFDENSRILILGSFPSVKSREAASCRIEGASDSSIRDAVPTDLSVLLAHAPIRAVFCNGQTAFRLYGRYQEQETGLPATLLPSTSPANAAYSIPRLLESWRIILPALQK